MNFSKILVCALVALTLYTSGTQARCFGPYCHRPSVSFGLSVGAPVVYQRPCFAPCVYRPCVPCAPVVYHTPCIPCRPHVSVGFGAGPMGFGFTF